MTADDLKSSTHCNGEDVMRSFDYRDVFGWSHTGACCDHAIDVDFNDSEPTWGGVLYRCAIDGVAHITDRYVAIRADCVRTFDHPVIDATDVDTSNLAITPLDGEPGPGVALHPDVAGRIVDCGLTLRATADAGSAGTPLVAIMSGDEHVGVYQSARAGVGYGDLLRCVEVAREMEWLNDKRIHGTGAVADVLVAAGVVTKVEVPS